jgi:hypothetical protein
MKVFKYLTTVLIVLLFFSCAKETIITDSDFQKNILAGTGNYQNTSHVWRLDSLIISGAAVKLTTVEKNYTKSNKKYSIQK